MSKCVNINSPEFKSLVEQTGSDPLILSAMMGNWMELNNTDEWPTLEQLGIGIIKPGVVELFESNPELANSVYEALGFNFRYTSEKWKDDPTKENKATYINIKGTPSNQEFQIKKDLEDGFYSVHFKTEQGKLTKEQIQTLVDAIASQIPIGGKLSTWGEITKGGISGLNRFLNNGFKKVGERKIKDKEGNPIVIPILEKVEGSNLEQQAQQLYSQYLDTIFPDSKVKDIVYHGTDRKIENEKFKKSRDGAYGAGIYFDSFDNAKGLAEFIGDRRGGSPNVIAAIVNIVKFGEKDGDGIKEGTEVKVNESSQIHILGSKQDIEGFKQYVNSNKSSQDTQYQLPKGRQLEEYIASEKTIRDLAARMSDRIGIPIRFESDRTKEYKGKLEDNTAYINLVYATLDTPFHEILAHPIIRAIKNKNDKKAYYEIESQTDKYVIVKNQQGGSKVFNTLQEANDFIARENTTTLYQSLLKELETGRGKEVFEQVKRDYKYKKDNNRYRYEYVGDSQYKHHIIDTNKKWDEDGYITQFETKEEAEVFTETLPYTLEEQQEEAIVTLLGELAAGKLEEKENASLKKKLLEFWKQISDFVRQLLLQDEIRIDELPITTTLNDLAEIMGYGNNKIILPGYKVEYSTPLGNKYETLEEVNNEIRGLANANVEVDLSDVTLNRDTNNYIVNDINDVKKWLNSEIEFPRSFHGITYYPGEDVFMTTSSNPKERREVNNGEVIDKFNLVLDSYKKRGINNPIENFIEKNKEYEQSKEIIEEWKKENNIQYDPEEVYSRGQGFYSSIGAYSNLEIDLLFQNLLQHIEDNKKAGGEFTISAFTRPIDKRLKHLEGTGDRVRFVIYPKSEDIKWAAPTDVYSGSVWNAHEKVSKDKKSELIGVSFTKAPALRNINEVSPNLAGIIDNLSHVHNELGIELTTNNFRIEYDDNIDYSTKKLIDNINKILDDKYGKLEKPEVKVPESKKITKFKVKGEPNIFNTREEAQALANKLSQIDYMSTYVVIPIQVDETIGKQPTQTRENTTSIESVKSKIVKYNEGSLTDKSEFTEVSEKEYNEAVQKGKKGYALGTTSFGYSETYEYNDFIYTQIDYDKSKEMFISEDEFQSGDIYGKIKKETKEYTSQAEINLKIAALKEVARKYPRSLIRSEVRPIDDSNKNYGFEQDELPFQLVGGTKNIFLRTELPGRERLLGNEFLEESDTYLKSTSGKYRNQNQDVKEKYFFDGNVQTIDTILDRIINSGNPLSKLASQIKKAASITGVEVEFVSNDFEVEGADNNKWTGIYVKDKKKIYIKGKAYTSSEALLMHEIIHAVSVEYIKNNSEDPLVKELKSLYEYAKKNINTEEYGFTDEYEFIAELFTNSSFASKLMDIKATKPSKYSNLFEEFWDTMVGVILKFYGKAIKGDTLYEQAFAIGTHIIENQYEQTLFMKDLMDMPDLENSYKDSNFYFEKDAPINRNSILYKKLIKAFPKRHVDTMYRELTSPSFMEWYGNGVKDEEGNPRVTSQFVVSRMYLEGKFNLFSDVKFETKEEVEKFLLALDSAGISKFKGSYYISKNNRENALNWIKRIETTHPGLLKLYPAKTQEGVLGKSDQSMHIVRIGINEDYFGNGQLFPFIQTKQEDPIKNSDPRDYIIRRLEEYNIRIYNLVRDAKKEKKQDLVNKYEELFKNNVESIKILKEERNIASILKRAQSDLSYVKSVLSQKEVDSNDLIEIGRLIDLYTNIAEVGSKSALITVEDLKPRAVVKINEQGEEIIEQDITALTKSIQEIGGQFKSQSQLYDDILKKIATREFNAAFDQDIQEEKLFEATEDLRFIDKTRGVMSMRSRLLNLLGMIRTAALQKAEAETLRDEKVREKMNESLKGSSLFNRLGRIKFMDLFWQKDEKGQITGGLINKYSNKYWDFIRSYGEGLKSDKKNVRNAAKKRHYNNHEYVNYFETEEERQAEIDRLNSIIENITLVEEIVSDAEEKFIEYRERRDQRFDNIEGSDLTKERKEFEKDKWIKENNPSETIKNLKEGTESSNPEGGVYFNSFEFVRSIPLKIDRTGKKTEWYDSAFEQIQSDPIAYEYYNYVRKKIKELISFYPQSYLDSKSIHKGFIFQIKNSLMKEFKQQGIIGSLKGARSLSTELIKKWTTIKTFSKATDHVDPGTGSPINTLGIAMLSPKFNTIENGKLIESNDIVKDLDEILASFIPVTNIYKHKARVEATYNLVAESAGLLKGIKTNKSGSWLRNKATDEIYTDPANLNNLEELVQFEVDTFYGVQQSKHEKGSKKKTLNKVEKEELEKINKRLEEISDKLSNREELTEEEEKNLEKEQLDLSVKRDDMGASFSGTKSLKSWLKWYQLLSQGWNLHSPVIELIYGFMTNYIHASGGRDYSTSQIRRAYSIAMTAVIMSGKSSESRKFNNIIEKFNIIGEVFENDGDGTNSRNRISAKNLIKPYHFMKNMDKITKGSAAVAVMMNTTIESIDGKKSNLYDALDENGELKPEFQTEENISKWTINTESTEINDIQRLRAKINEINIRNTGNYDPNQPIPVNSKAAGQAILQFRRFLLEGFAQRFEKERESDTLGRKIKGRYITYRDLGIKNSASIILKMLLKKATFQKISDEDLIEMGVEDEVDIENMRKNATGVIMTIMLTMGMLILSKMFDDDDEKDFSLLNFTLNMGGRLQQDLWFYSNPGTANDFLGNIVPSARLYDKITGWMEASFKQIFTDYDQDWSTEYERGELKGWNKMTIKTGELIPGSSAAIKAYRLGTKIIE